MNPRGGHSFIDNNLHMLRSCCIWKRVIGYLAVPVGVIVVKSIALLPLFFSDGQTVGGMNMR